MGIGIITDKSTAREFVWEVCDNVDANNVCQHKPPKDASADWKPPHETYTYGYEPDKTATTAQTQKDKAYAELGALLKARAAVNQPSALPALTGKVA